MGYVGGVSLLRLPLLLLLLQLLPQQPATVVCAAAHTALPAVVVFPSGEEYIPLADQSPPGYEDLEDTGSLAFERRPQNARFAWGVTLADWTSVPGGVPATKVFRAHPALIACLAGVNSRLQRDGDRLAIRRGYVPLKEAGSVTPKFPMNFHAAGSAVEISIRSAVTVAEPLPAPPGPGPVPVRSGVQRRLAAAFGQACASRLTADGWDFSLSALNNAETVLIALKSQRRPAALEFLVEAATTDFADAAALESWTREQWQLGFLTNDFNATTELDACPQVPRPLASHYQRQEPPELIVGPADELASPPDSPDYLRLMQYPAAGQLEFPACPKLLGSWRGVKCSTRLMSPRMYESTRRLQALLLERRPGWRLRVDAGWEAPVGERPSLRSEGRQLELTPLLPDGDPVSIPEATRLVADLAVCAGFDYVSTASDVDAASTTPSPRLKLAVIKQVRPADDDLSARRPVVLFQQVGHLTPVEPPARLAEQYSVTGVDPVVLEDRPLFDGALNPDTPLGSHARLGMFISRSKEFRYFRLHPALAACYDALVEQANRLYQRFSAASESSEFVGVSVLRSYLTEFEERALLEPASDPRVSGHPEGAAMQVAFDAASPGYRPELHTVWHLADLAATACTPRFHEHRGLFGIGVYNDSVYVDIRPIAKVWLECEPETTVFATCPLKPPPSEATVGSLRASGSSSADFKAFLLEKALQAIQGRVVEPLAGSSNCEFDLPPRDQSPDFVYRPRRQRPSLEEDALLEVAEVADSPASDRCQYEEASEFCRKSTVVRAALVGHLWSDISAKHLLAGALRVREALEACLLTCSNSACAVQSSSLWQRKLAACESLAHWLPFDLENDLPGRLTNLYTPGDSELRRLACYSGEHCVDWSPLYSLLNPTLSASFRPNPNGAAKENLYDVEGNPSPLMGIVRRLYGHYARGAVKVWLRNENDVKSMLEELKVIFLYNKHVTSVTFMVLDSRSVNQVASQVENEFGEWLQEACPESARGYLTPHEVVAVGTHSDDAAAFAAAAAASNDAVVRRGLHPSIDSIDLRNW